MITSTRSVLLVILNYLTLIFFIPTLFAESIVVMSYNIHRGGIIHKKQPLSQTAKGIQLAKADIVGIQETRSPRGDTLKDLAKLLGWNHDEGSSIVTRYEIVEHFKNGKGYKGGIKVSSLQISMPTSLICTSHPTPTNPISFWASVPDGTSTPIILPLSKPRQRRLNGPKKHAARTLLNF